MVMIAGFARTTIMLIVICALGVSGHVTTLTPYRDVFVAETDLRITCAWGGFILFNPLADDMIRAHEYGHLQQEKKYEYLHEILVVIPSLISATLVTIGKRPYWRHLAMPCELEATELGRQ